MMTIPFYKYQGTGNDFVMIDHRNAQFPLNTAQIKAICDRRFGIGADGLILLENHPDYDFKMVYYNADGQESTMCGNGGRCIVAFAQQLGIINSTTRFIAIDGEHEAAIDTNGLVHLKMVEVQNVQVLNAQTSVLNTGSPHYVHFIDTPIETFPVYEQGQAIRYSEPYQLTGINVNFCQKLSAEKLYVRTYERGVEDETFSCGTGVTAAAIAARFPTIGDHLVSIQTLGGALQVSFTIGNTLNIENIFLIGPAKLVFSGVIHI